MQAHFAEVLNREAACLTAVNYVAALMSWCGGLVEELMSPRSPYVKALRPTGDLADRGVFLDRWRDLIAEAVDRILPSSATDNSVYPEPRVDIDSQRTAVLILAVLHGGSILSQVAQDAGPLNAALEFALVPLARAESEDLAMPASDSPVSNMGS